MNSTKTRNTVVNMCVCVFMRYKVCNSFQTVLQWKIFQLTPATDWLAS